MHADAAVNPDCQHERDLLGAEVERAAPQPEQFPRITSLEAECGRDARPDEMSGEQKGDGQTEPDLNRLEPRVIQSPPREQRPEAQGHMDEQATKKRDCGGRRAPDELLPSQRLFHGRERDIAEHEVENVLRHIGEQD